MLQELRGRCNQLCYDLQVLEDGGEDGERKGERKKTERAEDIRRLVMGRGDKKPLTSPSNFVTSGAPRAAKSTHQLDYHRQVFEDLGGRDWETTGERAGERKKD